MQTPPAENAARLPVFLALGVIVAALALADIAPDRNGPGVTCDELYHIGYGKRLVASAWINGFWTTDPERIRETYSWTASGPPVHPPLGNWILGLAHWVFDPEPLDLTVLAITSARFASALALGVLVFLVGWFVAGRQGMAAGAAAAIAVVLMPRLFGHAHLATLDLFTALFCTAAVTTVAGAQRRGNSLLWYAAAGSVWGLALLTRFHGLLVGIPIGIWILWAAPRRRMAAFALWASTGLIVFFMGWPWLWLDPLGNLRLYVIGSTVRTPIHTFYMGRVWNDVAVPWHYPWVLFAVTIPVGLLLLGALGIWGSLAGTATLSRPVETATRKGGKSDAQTVHLSHGWWLVLGTIVFFLVLFSAPGVPIYDGERLLLPVFPLWAVFVGIGSRTLVDLPSARWQSRPASHRWICLAAFLLLQGVGILWLRPAWLSYYNALTGGLWGAERLGFDVSYWGDGISENLLRAVAEKCEEGGTAGLAPSLAPFQAPALVLASPSLAEKQVRLIGWSRENRQPRWLVLYHRRADLHGLPPSLFDRPPLAEVRRQGVWLARVVPLNDSK